MRHIVVLLSALAVALAGSPGALAAENKNSVTFDIHCTSGGQTHTFTGTLLGGAGGALHLEGGGLSIAMGIKTVDGQILADPNPGLSQQGKLVECRFRLPGEPADLIAFAYFPQGL